MTYTEVCSRFLSVYELTELFFVVKSDSRHWRTHSRVPSLLTICLNDGKKLSISATTLKKIIVGGAENRAVFLILVHRVRIIILLKIEILLLLRLVCETNLISLQYSGIALSLSTASLIIRWGCAIGLILVLPKEFRLLSPSTLVGVRRWPSLKLLRFIGSILLRSSTSLLMAHLPAPLSSLT